MRRAIAVVIVLLAFVAVLVIPVAAAPGDVVIPEMHSREIQDLKAQVPGQSIGWINYFRLDQDDRGIVFRDAIMGSGADRTITWAYGDTSSVIWWAFPSSENTAAWMRNFSDYSLERGKVYSVDIGNFYLYLPRAVRYENVWTEAAFAVGVLDAQNNVVVSKQWDFNETTGQTVVAQGRALGWSWSTASNDGFSFEFAFPETLDEQEFNGYKFSVQIVVRAKSASGNIRISEWAYGNPWIAFEGVQVLEGETDESRWQDEQRGFWERLWQMLQGMWDAILSIPQKIGEWFQQLFAKIEEIWTAIKDFFELIWRWISFIFRLVIKAMEIMMALSSSLPIWVVGAFVALVAVCVVYKILGREASG